jgi:hypothetical protein
MMFGGCLPMNAEQFRATRVGHAAAEQRIADYREADGSD